MNNAKFTPGPWHNEEVTAITAYSEGEVRPWYVASVHRHIGDGADQMAANAHLIAAAPELYEALEECRALLDGEGGMPVGVRERADAALAKALGK